MKWQRMTVRENGQEEEELYWPKQESLWHDNDCGNNHYTNTGLLLLLTLLIPLRTISDAEDDHNILNMNNDNNDNNEKTQ